MSTLRLLLPATLLVLAPLAAGGFPNLGDLVEKGANVAKSGKKIIKGGTGLSLEDEVVIGDAVSVEIVGRYAGIWRNPEATRRINLIGRVLSRYAQRQDLEWRFGLLNSDEINAFSAPGGRVFITRGLYKLVANDDELAGVLGHEIEHVDRRHALKIIARGELIEGLKGIAAESGKYDVAKYDDAVSKVTSNLLDKGYDKGSEFDADKFGRELAATSGFAPGGLRAVIEKLRAKTAGGADKTFSTHPTAESRLEKLPKDPAPATPAPAPAKK